MPFEFGGALSTYVRQFVYQLVAVGADVQGGFKPLHHAHKMAPALAAVAPKGPCVSQDGLGCVCSASRDTKAKNHTQ